MIAVSCLFGAALWLLPSLIRTRHCKQCLMDHPWSFWTVMFAGDWDLGHSGFLSVNISCWCRKQSPCLSSACRKIAAAAVACRAGCVCLKRSSPLFMYSLVCNCCLNVWQGYLRRWCFVFKRVCRFPFHRVEWFAIDKKLWCVPEHFHFWSVTTNASPSLWYIKGLMHSSALTLIVLCKPFVLMNPFPPLLEAEPLPGCMECVEKAWLVSKSFACLAAFCSFCESRISQPGPVLHVCCHSRPPALQAGLSWVSAPEVRVVAEWNLSSGLTVLEWLQSRGTGSFCCAALCLLCPWHFGWCVPLSQGHGERGARPASAGACWPVCFRGQCPG